MTVEVRYSKPKDKWEVIETKKTDVGMGSKFSSTSTHNTRSAAVNKARRVARSGEKITLTNTKGQVEVIRQGEFLP